MITPEDFNNRNEIQQQHSRIRHYLSSLKRLEDNHPKHIPLISLDDGVILGDRIGTGSFCQVYEATIQSKSFALKCQKRHNVIEKNQTFSLHESIMEGIMDLGMEAKILASLDHENIIKLHAISKRTLSQSFATTTSNNNNNNKDIGYFMVLEKVHETLHDKLLQWQPSKTEKQNKSSKPRFLLSLTSSSKKKPQVQPMENDVNYHYKIQVALQIADAMTYLHEKILYRDLKPQNIGLDVHGNVKLLDFGLARFISTKTKDRAGTLGYMANEVAMDESHSTKASDVYSFGIVLYEMLTLSHPFAQYLSNCKKFKQKVHQQQWRPKLSATGLPKSMQTLIASCWHADPNERPTFEQIHQVLQNEL